MTQDEKVKAHELGINTSGDLLDPRFDYVFKRIFTAQENESKIALIDFLNSVLTDKKQIIVDLTVLNTEVPVEAYKRKKTRFDIRVVFDNDEFALVEMEFNKKDDFAKRSLHNISRLYSSQSINRLEYRNLKRCYMVGVMGYNILDNSFDYLNTFSFRDENGREMSDDMQITYIELEKTAHMLEKPPEELTNAECWALFLRYASYNDKQEILEKIAEKNRGVGMATNVLKYMSKSEIERMAYEDALLAEIDREAEIDFAVREARKEMTRNLLKIGVPVEQISQATGFTFDEIEKIKEEM